MATGWITFFCSFSFETLQSRFRLAALPIVGLWSESHRTIVRPVKAKRLNHLDCS